MGKRKSSPRLATTSSNDVVTSIISTIRIDIRSNGFFFQKSDVRCDWIFCICMLG